MEGETSEATKQLSSAVCLNNAVQTLTNRFMHNRVISAKVYFKQFLNYRRNVPSEGEMLNLQTPTTNGCFLRKCKSSIKV